MRIYKSYTIQILNVEIQWSICLIV